jgi:hypothetical protein
VLIAGQWSSNLRKHSEIQRSQRASQRPKTPCHPAAGAHSADVHAPASVERLHALQRLADRSVALQRIGQPPYPKDITLQTKYVTLALKYADRSKSSVQPGEVRGYLVTRFSAQGKDRPPVWSKGVQQAEQGQHKVAWVAIWTAIEQCVGYDLTDATTVMNQIINQSGIAPTNDPVQGNVLPVGNVSTPQAADNLLMLAHNYLAGRQQDDPSWAVTGTQAQVKAQLSGKGERALRAVLSKWQIFDPDDPKDLSKAIALLKSPGMDNLFDTTGRKKKERIDAANRAISELEIHNNDLFGDVEDQVRTFVAAKAQLTVSDL